MPETIGAAIISAVATAAGSSASVAAAASTATVIGTTVTAAQIVGSVALLGGSLAVSALTTPDVKQKVQAQQFSVKQPLPPRRRAWGVVMLGGPFFAWKPAGGAMITAIYLCEGPIGRFLEFWLDDTKAALDAGSLGGPAGVDPWYAAVTIDSRLGTADQTASTLLKKLPFWSDDHRLAGCAYMALAAQAPAEKNFKKVYPSGSWPNGRALFEAARVRNPADSAQTSDPATWQWSDRAGVVIRDHLTHPDWGMKVPESLIDDASFIAFGQICDETLIDKNGVAFPRYYVGGAHELTADPADALQGMLDASDSRLYLTPAGRIGITGGRYIPPEVTIGHADLLSVGSIEQGSGKRASFNRLKTSFTSRLHGFQLTEGDAWDDLAAQEEAGEILEADFPRAWVQNHAQLRRLAKIHTARQNPRWRITGLVTNRGGLPALFEDTVLLDLPRYGISGPFEIQRAIASGDGATCTFDLVSIDPAAWAFDPATEQGLDPPLPNTDVEPDELDPPADLAAVIEQRAVSGDINAVFLHLTADAPEREDLSLIGQYRKVGTDPWLTMGAEGEERGSVISSVLEDGAEYEVQGAIATYGRAAQSAWTPTDPPTVTATADTTPPGAPTGFVANGGNGQASGAFTAPNSANFGFARLYRGTSTDFSQATVIRTFNGSASQSFNWTDARPAGTYRYWVRAFNRSGFGDASSTVGPITVTVT